MYSGRTYYELIERPIDLLAYLKRLGNWSELGVSYNWGITPVSGILLKTSGQGSYLADKLEPIRNQYIAFQLFGDTWVNDLVQKVCEQFNLISYQDENGYECLDYYLATESPSETITWADLIGDTSSLTRKTTHCTPTIKYAYDQASQAYTRELKIKNVWLDTFDPSYLTGFSDPVAYEALWTLCKELYERNGGIIEEMPETRINREFIYREEDAILALIDEIFLMSRYQISLTVSYSKGRKYHPGTHFMLNHNIITNGQNVECVIENVSFAKSVNKVNIDALVIGTLSAGQWSGIVQDIDFATLKYQNTDSATLTTQEGDLYAD